MQAQPVGGVERRAGRVPFFVTKVAGAKDQLPVRSRFKIAVRIAIDRAVQHGAAIFVAKRRQIGAAARKT
jgi:hypothetical protein